MKRRTTVRIRKFQAAAVHQDGPYPVGQAYAENAAMAMQQQSQEPANHLREERAPRAAHAGIG